jgi:uncharacterized protein YggU (UPF0235/DUF167 family)
MSKKPSVQSEYHGKKDRLEITIKHSGLKKKARKNLVKRLEQNLKEGVKGGKRTKDPYKETKIPEVGD